MRRRILRFSLCLLTIVGSHNAAIACSPPPARTDDQIRELARESFADADVIADIVVEMAANPDPNLSGVLPMAAVKPIKVWKGVTGDLVAVLELSTCDLLLQQQGALHRVMLKKVGDTLFTADLIANGVSVRDPKMFNQEIDRLLGDQRGIGFTDVGVMQAPTKTVAMISSRRSSQNRGVFIVGLASAIFSSAFTWLTIQLRSRRAKS